MARQSDRTKPLGFQFQALCFAESTERKMDKPKAPREKPKVNEVAAATARAELRRRGYSDREVDGMIKGRTGWRNSRD